METQITDMKLALYLPVEKLLEVPVRRILAEAENGSFCLLPRHVDFVAALVPGILSYEPLEGGERFVAVDRGLLVKCGREVRVSTYRAVEGEELGRLEEIVRTQFAVVEEHDRTVRAALRGLEVDVLRRFSHLARLDSGPK